MAWHDSKCVQLDFVWEDGRPGCNRCKRSAPAVARKHPLPPPSPPPHTRRSELKCSWPPGLEYVFNPRLKTQELLIRSSIDGWQIGHMLTISPGTLHHSNAVASPEHMKIDDAKTSSDLIYSRLEAKNALRLLRLTGCGSIGDPVHCSLAVIQLADPNMPTYEAVSYTWADQNGDASLCEPIYVGPDYHILLVTRNCLVAPRRFRRPWNRYLWVDAICINQKDLPEREEQVSLMQQIYKPASRVLVSVGDENAGVEDEMISKTNSEMSLPGKITERIVDMPYFYRVWVIQEIKFAQKVTVTIGEKTVHLEALQNRRGEDALAIKHGWIRSGHDPILKWLMKTLNCHCSDPRDKVFALLGLVPTDESIDLPIDYGLSAQELFTGLACYWIKRNQLDFLDFAIAPKRIPFLPSWVPDWTFQYQDNRYDTLTTFEQAHVTILAIQHRLSLPVSPKSTDSSINAHGNDAEETRIFDILRLKDEGKKTLVLRGLGISVRAIENFSVQQQEVLMTCIKDKPLKITSQISLGGISMSSSDHYHVFHIPSLNRAFTLQKHADEIYSMKQHCDIRISNTYLKYYDGKSVIGIQTRELLALESWADLMWFFKARSKLSSEETLSDAISQEWLRRFPERRRRVLDVPFLLQSATNQSPTSYPFELMNLIRQAIMEILSQNDLESSEGSPALWVDLSKAVTIHDPHNFDGETRVLLKRWVTKHIDTSPEVELAYLGSLVKVLRSESDKHDSISAALQDVHETDYEPYFVMPQSECEHWYLVLGIMFEHLPEPELEGDSLGRLYTGKIFKRLYQLMKLENDLDPRKYWAWNRDRLYIHIVTLDFTLRLRELLMERRIMMRLHHAPLNPRRIVII